jgi:hypothetical protein
MSKQDNGTGNVHQLHKGKATKYEPLDGWTVQTKYGTLRLPDGVDCVRLADVHAWMARDGKPIDMVIDEIFHPLLVAAGDVCIGYTREEANSIRILSALHLVKVTGHPVPLFEPVESCRWNVDPLKCENVYSARYRGALGLGRRVTEANRERYVPQITFAREMDIDALRAAFPDQGHYVAEDGTVDGLLYSIFTGAKRLLVVGVDVHTDARAAHERKIEAIAEKNYEIKWPRDEVVTIFLNRLAVPIPVAHELWGWGRAVPVEAETQAAPAGESETNKQTRHVWTPEKRQKLLDDFNEAGGKLQKEKLAQVAKQWGLALHNARKQIKLARKAQKTNYATGLGGRKSTR